MPQAPLRSGHRRGALAWSGEEQIDAHTLAVAALRMAVPTLIGLAIG